MAFTTITIPADVHSLLRSLKQPGESFGDVIRRRVRPPADPCGELLDRLEDTDRHLPPADPALEAKLHAGRGRRTDRPAPRA